MGMAVTDPGKIGQERLKRGIEITHFTWIMLNLNYLLSNQVTSIPM